MTPDVRRLLEDLAAATTDRDLYDAQVRARALLAEADRAPAKPHNPDCPD
jgi:hypothetical protein